MSNSAVTAKILEASPQLWFDRKLNRKILSVKASKKHVLRTFLGALLGKNWNWRLANELIVINIVQNTALFHSSHLDDHTDSYN